MFENYIRRLKSAAETLEAIGRCRPMLEVRTRDGASYPNGTRVSDVFAWQEYGTDRIAPKAFVRRTFDENLRRYETAFGKNVKSVANGKLPMATALDRMAQSLAKDVRKACPVRTGTLRDAIEVRASMEGREND